MTYLIIAMCVLIALLAVMLMGLWVVIAYQVVQEWRGK